MNPLDLLNMRKMALSGANRRPASAAFLDMAGQTGQAPQGPMPSIAESARLRALKALGATQQPTAAITKPRLITPTSAASGAGSLLPGRGTPGSAALGAFGQTMSQLGGWQDKPMTFGQILGASLGKAREAYGTAEERQRKIAADKAAAERQAMLDEYTLRELQIKEAKEKREAAAKPKRESKVVDGALYEYDPGTGKWEVAVAKTTDETPFKPGSLYDFPVNGGTQKGYIGQDGQIVYVGGVKKPEVKKPGMPNIGNTRTIPTEKGYEQVQEFADLGNGTFGYKNIGEPKPTDAPKTPSIGTSYKTRNDDGTVTEAVYTIEGWKTSSPYNPDKPSELFKNVYSTKSGKRIGSFRADDERLKEYEGSADYEITNSGQVTGTEEEVLGMGKATQSKLELNINDMLVAKQQLGEIKTNFDPDMLSVPGIVQRRIAELKDLFNSSSPEDKAVIEAYTTWKNSAFGYANAVIKAVTGAQMSEPEAQRIMKELPDPRSFKGTPTEYLAALKVAERKANASITRAQYFLENGIQPQLVDMPDGTKEYFFRDKKGRLVDLSQGSVNYMYDATATSLRERFKDDGLKGQDLENAIDNEMARIFRNG